MADYEYLVRGAKLKCSRGSHASRINLPVSHGLYMKEKPQIIDTDCTEKNIQYFGVCGSATPPGNTKDTVIKQDGRPIHGRRCCPDIIGKWQNVHGNSVTMDSYMVCACGGCIEPITSGQEFTDAYQGGK